MGGHHLNRQPPPTPHRPPIPHQISYIAPPTMAPVLELDVAVLAPGAAGVGEGETGLGEAGLGEAVVG